MAAENWHSKVELYVTPPKFKGSVKHSFEVLPEDFDPVPAKKSGRFIIIGFDTEFKTPDFPMTREEIGQGFGKYAED